MSVIVSGVFLNFKKGFWLSFFFLRSNSNTCTFNANKIKTLLLTWHVHNQLWIVVVGTQHRITFSTSFVRTQNVACDVLVFCIQRTHICSIDQCVEWLFASCILLLVSCWKKWGCCLWESYRQANDILWINTGMFVCTRAMTMRMWMTHYYFKVFFIFFGVCSDWKKKNRVCAGFDAPKLSQNAKRRRI